MKLKELKNLSATELESKCLDFRQELLNLRIRQTAGQLEKPSRLRELKTAIARAQTLITQAKSKKT
jgi:large subunit ribosomal protein L29